MKLDPKSITDRVYHAWKLRDSGMSKKDAAKAANTSIHTMNKYESIQHSKSQILKAVKANARSIKQKNSENLRKEKPKAKDPRDIEDNKYLITKWVSA